MKSQIFMFFWWKSDANLENSIMFRISLYASRRFRCHSPSVFFAYRQLQRLKNCSSMKIKRTTDCYSVSTNLKKTLQNIVINNLWSLSPCLETTRHHSQTFWLSWFVSWLSWFSGLSWFSRKNHGNLWKEINIRFIHLKVIHSVLFFV